MDDELVRGRLEEEQNRLAALRDQYVAEGLTSESEERSKTLRLRPPLRPTR